MTKAEKRVRNNPKDREVDANLKKRKTEVRFEIIINKPQNQIHRALLIRAQFYKIGGQ